MALYESYDMKEDTLLGGNAVVPLTKNVTIAAGTEMKRGTLVTVTDGVASATKKGEKASYILANETSKDDTVATVYSRGLFNREAVIVADGDTVEAHEEELRTVSIVFTSIKG